VIRNQKGAATWPACDLGEAAERRPERIHADLFQAPTVGDIDRRLDLMADARK
jgi:hypothetical protein